MNVCRDCGKGHGHADLLYIRACTYQTGPAEMTYMYGWVMFTLCTCININIGVHILLSCLVLWKMLPPTICYCSSGIYARESTAAGSTMARFISLFL